MIVYPDCWNMDYTKYMNVSPLDFIRETLATINITNLAYSGGIDSTILLHLLTDMGYKINTYTITCRKDHPDNIYANLGSSYYHATHHAIVMSLVDGDDAVRKLFEFAGVDSMICGDGIDEFSAGYYDHQNKYDYYLSKLTKDHLIPLNTNSKNVKVYLPYLTDKWVLWLSLIPVDIKYRKKVIINLAKELGLPKEIISRNKYGFCDANLNFDK